MKITIHTGDPSKIKYLADYCVNYPELDFEINHPKLQVQWVAKVIEGNKWWGSLIKTNSDHIINAFRVAKKQGRIEELIIYFYPFDSEDVIEIKVDENGGVHRRPKDFMTQYGELLDLLID